MKNCGWGILGPGNIVKRMMTALPHVPGAKLAAVGSRDAAKAAAFAKEYGFAKSYGSYTECIKDPDVDILYIAVPHPFHAPLAIQALEAGKAVLCEKPAAINAAEMKRIAECARKNHVFYMEGMWTRYFPVNRAIKTLIDSGKTGAVTLIEADFCFGKWDNLINGNPQARLFAPSLAGGSLLDVGIYTASYCDYIKNGLKPSAIKALAAMTKTGVDGMTAFIMQYTDGSLSVQRSGVVQTTRTEATIYCEKCTIEVPGFWHPTKATIEWKDTNTTDTIEIPLPHGVGEGFYYECEEAMRCINAGLTESPLMTLDDSIRVIEQLDAVRAQIGLRYPIEK
ncbi:MAG: Gfo/Idh/MocA family oxidoreductase [Treponema sp.]|nr:Gfo/Idh/MocA family oxidoreductase [Treponema sp.]